MLQKIQIAANRIKNDTGLLFIFKLVGIYFFWKVLHHFLLLPSFVFHAAWVSMVKVVGTGYAYFTVILLRLLGENITQIGVGFQFHPSTKIVYVEEHCLGFPAMLIFSAAILLYSKGFWKEKLWFIPLGLLGIIFINIARLVFLGLAFENFSSFFFSINHSYVYVAVTYGLIFSMIYWWMKKHPLT
jgi:exosortase/archaeosortase family protein